MNASREADGRRRGRTAIVATCAVVVVVLIFLASVGLTYLAGAGQAIEWDRLANVGQALEPAGTILSGLAMLGLVATLWLQREELRLQRHALDQQQRYVAIDTETKLRSAHLEILKMSLLDPDLAEVWPSTAPGRSVKIAKQYNYINLIMQLQRQALLSGTSKEEVSASIDYLFTSALIRRFWTATEPARATIIAGSTDGQEAAFFGLVDSIYRKHAGPTRSASKT